MAHWMCIATAVIFVITSHAPQLSQAQSLAAVGECRGKLLRPLQAYLTNMGSPQVCPIVADFAKCMLKASGKIITADNVSMFENRFESALATRPIFKGINCLFNYKVIADIEIGEASTIPLDAPVQSSAPELSDDKGGVQSRKNAPAASGAILRQTPTPEYDPKSDSCVSKFTAAAFKNDGQDVCSLVDQLLKCKLSKQPDRKFAEEEIPDLEARLQMQQARIGVSCQVDVRGVILEHNSNINGGRSVFGPAWLVRGMLASLGTSVLLKMFVMRNSL